MQPELFTVPIFGWPIKSYGFMMMVGFLTAVWMGMRRAQRVKASPDMILNCGMLCLLFGVGGARLFYVVHYWENSFAYLPHPFWSALDITAGGLEYLGGVIGATAAVAVYFAGYGRLFAKGGPRPSLRLYLDLLAPISIWGLALTRVGCFLNGCCWGGLCVQHQEVEAKGFPWAVRFPFSSPAHERQWMNRQARVPAELIYDEPPVTTLVPGPLLERSPEQYQRSLRELEEIEEQYQAEKAKGATDAEFKKLEARRKRQERLVSAMRMKYKPLTAAQQFPSRRDPTRATTPSELHQLSTGFLALPVHPAQLYDTMNALLLSWLLTMIYYHRKRHGVVFGWMLLLYPISRMILEVIRVDNPHDAGGLTISQAFSLGMFAFGIPYMIWLHKLPLRSRLAVPWIDPYAKPEAQSGPAKVPAPT